jgi:2-methylisocitrate lyase-like PEP mutase family enzyme
MLSAAVNAGADAVYFGLKEFSMRKNAGNFTINDLDEIVQSVREIIAAGIVGINIEDSIDLNPKLIDEMEFCERISAIRALSDSLGFHLVINARTDSFYTSSGLPREKLSESIKRGNRYQEAGADLSDP